MRLRLLSSCFAALLLGLPCLAARRSPDPTQARLAGAARMAAMTQSDFQTLLSQAQAGNAEAQFWLAGIYQAGKLVPQDRAQAETWMLRSAEAGYPRAQMFMGMGNVSPSCDRDPDCERDPATAEMWMKRAAAKGDPEAQFWLGTGYEQGWFGTPDFTKALAWYRKAAGQGHPDAQTSLGGMYYFGEGVKRNDKTAAKWFRKAGEHVPDLGGAGQGRNELGLLYLSGEGVPKDYVRAYMWFALAHADGNVHQAKSRMTPAQILRAQQMAEAWKRHHPDPFSDAGR
jgi:TPR repeat protein